MQPWFQLSLAIKPECSVIDTSQQDQRDTEHKSVIKTDQAM